MGISQSSRKAVYLALVIILLLPIGTVAEPSKTSEPIFKPELRTSLTTGSIRIDGDLTDPGWKSAGRVQNFVERSPGDNSQPEVPTEALLTYDSDNLYVAFICHDKPEDIRATMCQRDQFGADDAVCFLLDTYGDASWAYEFFVNPYGVQKDRLWSSVAGEDPGFDLVWKSAARITDTGYQVEIGIPFSSLRFPSQDVQSWRVDFWRNRPRNSYNQYSWAAYDRNERCWVCQWGRLEGIQGVQPGKGLEILPTIVANQYGSLEDPSDPGSRLSNSNGDAELSVGAKYAASSAFTVEAAYNPDFSQIEADADQIDVNTTIALFYPERRPFFQEGSDLFRTLFNSFYTRTVNDPGFAVKTISRTNGRSLAFLSARDDNTPYIIPLTESSIMLNTGKSYVNVLRGLQTLGEDNQVGFILTDRRFEDGGSGSVAALDADIRLSRTYGIDGQWILTHTHEPNQPSIMNGLESIPLDGGKYDAALNSEDYYGTGFITRFRRSARAFNFIIDYNQVSPSYRTETGYDPWVNYRNLSLNSYYNFYFQSGLFESITPSIYTQKRWNFDNGGLRYENFFLNLNTNVRYAQTYFGVYYYRGREAWSGIVFDGLWQVGFDHSSRITKQLSYSVGGQVGRQAAVYALVRGDFTSGYLSLAIKPVDRLLIEPGVNYTRSVSSVTDEELYKGYITRTRVQLQANKELSFRLVLQYNDFYETWDVDPLITYRLSSFSVFYLGSTYDYEHFNVADAYGDPQWRLSSRQFFMKLQYQLQI
jgi:hypothetical protein